MAFDREAAHRWHVAINQHHVGEHKHKHFMYEAKTLANEVPRLALLFSMERRGELQATHQQCSRSKAEPISENHLTCCRGVTCRECPALLALDGMAATPEQIDEAKAWTCAAHIVEGGGDVAGEGYVLTVDDRMFWDRVYSSLASSPAVDAVDPQAGTTTDCPRATDSSSSDPS